MVVSVDPLLALFTEIHFQLQVWDLIEKHGYFDCLVAQSLNAAFD